MASIIGHGLATRFPKLRFMPVEFGSGWIRPFYRKLQRVYDQAPVLFDENPVDVFKRSVWVDGCQGPDPKGLLDLGIPADHVMFGSDFPHPEGMEDPLAYSEVVKDLPMEDQALIMGGARAAAGGRSERLIAALHRMSNDDEFIDAAPTDYLEPGETATVDVDGVPVTLANAGGTWCAFESMCPHQATPLGGIPLTRNVLLRCPEHGSIFDVTTGQCVLPSEDGWSGPLRTYRTQVVDDVVQVSLH
jgi:nitrite reductase/ring-hydroxylating ferredoxin subunit